MMRGLRLASALGLLGYGGISAVIACSGSTAASPAATTGASGTGNQSSSDPAANATDASAPATCANADALKIVFAPAYSAFDGTNHYQIPAVVSGIDASLLVWTTSDDSKVTHTRDDSFDGEMFETTGSGDVTIFAAAGNLCGHSVLHITATTVDVWTTGSSRYNNGVGANRGTLRPSTDGGGKDVACTNCHGTTGSLGTVEHTPMQTAGFSDDDLKNIFMHGTTPDGLLAQPISNLTYEQWHAFHTWDMADDNEANGVVSYLRSLTPAPTGNADFGGAFGPGGRGPDGGPRPDGGFRGDGGGGPPGQPPASGDGG